MDIKMKAVNLLKDIPTLVPPYLQRVPSQKRGILSSQTWALKR